MSQLNPLNDLSRVYLDHVAQINQQNESDDLKRWEEGENELQRQIRISSGIIASGGAHMEEQKLDPVGKEDNDVNNDGKVDSSDSYLKKRRAAIGKAMGKKMKEEADNYVEAYVTELNKTMAGYQKGGMVKGYQKGGEVKGYQKGGMVKGYQKGGMVKKEETEVDEAMMPMKGYQKGGMVKGYQKGGEVKGYQKGGMVKGYQKGGMVKKEELELDEAERSIDDRLDRKDKLMKKTTRKAMDFARREGEAAGHARFNMSRLSRERDKLIAKKVKKEALSNWRDDLSDLIEVAPMTDVEAEKVVKEKKVNNKVTINPKMSEAVAQIGGELIAEKEVDVPDTRRTVDAIRAYDRSKDASRDATYDTMHGKKKKGDMEKKYAKKERGEIDKDDPNWKKRKYHTGMHGEEYIGKPKKKKKGHDCASKVKHEEFGIGNCIPKMHTLDENNMVTHYDVEFEDYIVENCPVEELVILQSSNHHHSEMKEGVVAKEVKALSKANKTMKDSAVVKADKVDTPNYKGQKFGVKEEDEKFIQKAIKRPGAFTRKAKAAGMGVQQFAKNVDDNPDKYSTRTKRQANLAQTLGKLSKEDVEELFYTLIAE